MSTSALSSGELLDPGRFPSVPVSSGQFGQLREKASTAARFMGRRVET